jgi:DNA-directed RNA polymerase subunit RPC12/RpoP
MIESTEGAKCPYCGYVSHEADEMVDIISYWGSEAGRVAFDCGNCGKVFWVEEQVTRAWCSFKEVAGDD